MDTDKTKAKAERAKEDAKAYAETAKTEAEIQLDALKEKLAPVVEFIKKNPALAAKVSLALLPILARIFVKKNEDKK